MLHLQRALADRSVVVLHGFGGIGKTALAAEAGRWFHRTGRFPGGAAFLSFEHGGSLSQLCSWVGQALSGDPDFLLGDGDPVPRVAALLRERPALIILDNFESVLGREPLMPPEELKALLDAVWTWIGGDGGTRGQGDKGTGGRVLITTRDVTFTDARFRPSQRCAHIELGGLATGDALALAAAVLDHHGIDRAAVDRQGLVDLMHRLGGHPLSLTLVLPHLREYSPAELSARFEQLLPGFTAGAARERNESLAVSLEFSLRRLGDETRAALPGLAVFQGGALENHLLAVTGIDPALWQVARAELEEAALVTIESLPGINLPFLRFHPTLLPYLSLRLPASRRVALEERYWQEYHAAAGFLYQFDDRHPHEARAIALRELPNLRRALDLCITAGQVATAVDFADSIARFLDVFGRWRERDAMMARIAGLQVVSAEGVTKAEYLLLSRQGETLLQQGRAVEAERLFRRLLAKMEAGMAYSGDEAAYDHAMTLFRLGRCLAAQGRPARAIEYHRRALDEFERISESSESAKGMLGKVYTDVGDNLAAVGRFDEAQRAYGSGLEISKEIGDHRSVGVKLGQLGTLALERGDLAGAGRRYAEALETFRALGEPQMEAVAWHQLGRVAQEDRDWDEAERCYREAVRICEQIRDLPNLAASFNQLARVAEGAGRPDDAERWYLRAIELGEELRYYAELGKWLSNLANLYLSQGRLDEAARYAHRAVDIKETLDLSAEPWTTYSILAQIAAAQGRADEAAGWRRKEQESYAAYAGAAHEIRGWIPVIQVVAAACEGDVQAVEQANAFLQRFEEGWPTTVAAVRRILAGERDIEVLRGGLTGKSYVVIHTILAQLAAPAPGKAEAQTSEVSETSEASEAVARLRQQWQPVVQATLTACRGDAEAASELTLFLEQLSVQHDWRDLAAALRSILDGERAPDTLLPGLDTTDALIVTDVLHALGVETNSAPPMGEGDRVLQPGPVAPGSPPPLGEGLGERGEEMTLDDLLTLVALACHPDAPQGLGEQLYGLTHALATQPGAPAGIRALGRVLNRVLSGERDPDLAALPPELAHKLRQMLAALE